MKRWCGILCICSIMALLFAAALPEPGSVGAYSPDTKKVEAETREGEQEEGEQAAGEQAAAVEAADAAALELTAVSVVLMEGSTGTVLYSKKENSEMPPASITKIMTLLLIFEALDEGKISLADLVTVSEHAAGKGGSQVYLEPGETQTVEDMIKCISIASANDAAAAMAEFIAGSEEEFAKRMNSRAAELGMEHTNFLNCTGLDVENHYSSALDVAKMSRELITKFPEVSKYSTTWMDTIIHRTKRGESEFGLTNTNKLVRTYDGITGLKTGSTDKAKFCLSATASRNGCSLIAVVMGCPSPKDRFEEAAKLLNYGFANCTVYENEVAPSELLPVPVKGGVEESVQGRQAEPFRHLFLKGEDPEDVAVEIQYTEELPAPVAAGDPVGIILYTLDGTEIGRVPICADVGVARAGYGFYLERVFRHFLFSKPPGGQGGESSVGNATGEVDG